MLFPVFQAMMLRWWPSGLRFGVSRLRRICAPADLPRLCALSVLCCVFSVPLDRRREVSPSSSASVGARYDDYPACRLATHFRLVAMLGFSTIYQVAVKLGLWRLAANPSAWGRPVLDEVHAAGAPSSAVGEGLADALNVGGI